jgi:hypothetical protein
VNEAFLNFGGPNFGKYSFENPMGSFGIIKRLVSRSPFSFKS